MELLCLLREWCDSARLIHASVCEVPATSYIPVRRVPSIQQGAANRLDPLAGFRRVHAEVGSEIPERPADAPALGFLAHDARVVRARFQVRLLVGAELAQVHGIAVRVAP